MKKIILAIAALALLASPVMALDWDFYGSARMQTSYHTWDRKDATTNTFQTSAFTTQVGNNGPNWSQDDDDSGLYWDKLGTSRVGARVKGDPVQGRFETSFSDSVGVRLLWGQWKINSGLRLRLGRDWRPLNYFYSGQQVNDAGMAGPEGAGGVISHRDDQVKLIIGEGQNLQIAFVEPQLNANTGTADVDYYMPIIEANYHFAADAFFFDVGGAFASYDMEGAGTIASPDDKVQAWVVTAGGGFNFGPAYIKGNVGYGLNLGDLGMVTNQTFARNSAKPNADGEWDDNDTLLALGVIGMRFTDQLAIEGGVGYETNEDDINNAKDDETWAFYGHLNYTAAPGVSIIPEIGYIDLMDNGNGVEEGDSTYFSIKWQIDF
jgi:hypothetical protein